MTTSSPLTDDVDIKPIIGPMATMNSPHLQQLQSPPLILQNHHLYDEKKTPEYLSELLRDKKLIEILKHSFPFQHVERLLEEEITKVRENLFHLNGVDSKPMPLPDAEGEPSVFHEKVHVPVDEFPEFNFVGRILGPRGLTAKQLETDTGCKIMVRGRGSMRDKQKEDQMRGKPNWEHLDEALHVLIQTEDSENRAKVKLHNARIQVQQLLKPAEEGKDSLKKTQLAILAIENDKFRPGGGKASPKSIVGTPLIAPAAPSHHHHQHHLQQPFMLQQHLRPISSPNLMKQPFLQQQTFMPHSGLQGHMMTDGAGQLFPMMQQHQVIDYQQLLNAQQQQQHFQQQLQQSQLPFSIPMSAAGPDGQVGAIKSQKLAQTQRPHPYQRS